MPCDRTELLRHLAVEQPKVLHSDTWSDHLQDCGECRAERRALERTLAVFRQVEGDRLGQTPPAPGWEELSALLERAGRPRGRRPRSGLRLPMAAAAGLLVAVVSGVLFWPTAVKQDPPLPNLVTIEPEEQYRLDGGPLRRGPRMLAVPERPVRSRLGGNRFRAGPGPGSSLARRPIAVGNPAPVLLFRSLRPPSNPRLERYGLRLEPFEPPSVTLEANRDPNEASQGAKEPSLTLPTD